MRVLEVRLTLEGLAGDVCGHVTRALAATLQHIAPRGKSEAAGGGGGHGRLRLAVLDHVVSFPPVVLPVARLVAQCRVAGAAAVLVDGAHAVGALPDLDVPSLGADYYISNL
jgi:hypothetical protein